MNSCHFGRHRFTHPAAQGQQGDHEDENQTAHVLMIRQLSKSSKKRALHGFTVRKHLLNARQHGVRFHIAI